METDLKRLETQVRDYLENQREFHDKVWKIIEENKKLKEENRILREK